jgi:lipoprotein-anchoring transpeptidase ErfK/SrfK
MSRFSVAALVAGAGFMTLAGMGSASAQSLSQFGMWGEAPKPSAPPSMLGGPAMVKPTALASGGARPDITPQQPATVAFQNGFAPGSIVIDTAGRKLYYTLSKGSAYVYPIAVGKQGFAWTGVERVSRIEDWPDWIPPAEMRQRMPKLPVRMTGGVGNPLGAKAIYLGNTLYRIHGTNDTKSIGSAASSGCFRMHNAHVVHLAQHVNAQTVVFVMKNLPKSGTAMPPSSYQQVAKPTPAPQRPAEAAPPAAEAAPATPEQQPQAPEAQPQAPQPDAGASGSQQGI